MARSILQRHAHIAAHPRNVAPALCFAVLIRDVILYQTALVVRRGIRSPASAIVSLLNGG